MGTPFRFFRIALASIALAATVLAQSPRSGGSDEVVGTPDRVGVNIVTPPSVVEDMSVVRSRMLENPIQWVTARPALKRDNVGVPEIYGDYIDVSDDDAGGQGGIAALGNGWNAGGSGALFPPDPIMAAGPDHVIVCNNVRFRIYTKTGTQTLSTTWSSFFTGLPSANVTSDPYILYDHDSGRWFVGIGGFANPARYLMAVSQTSDPNGTWKKYSIDATLEGGVGTNSFGDYPKFGVSADALYITGNMFSSTSGFFLYVKLYVIPKQQLLDFAATLTFSDIANITDASGGSAFTLVPAQHWGAPQAPFLVDTDDSGTNTNTINVMGVNNPLGTPTLTKKFLAVSAYANPPNAEQPGGNPTLDTIDSRVYNAVWRSNSVWFAHARTANSDAACKFYEVSTAAWPASITVVQQGSLDSAGVNEWFPSIAVNAAGVMAMGLCRSGTAEFASIYYTYRNPGDALGTLQAPVLIQAGSIHYTGEGGTPVRWGDYTGTVVDPCDDTTFWHYNEYPNPSNAGQWTTWVQQFTTECGPSVLSQPASQPVCAGGSVAFSVTSNCAMPNLTFQWRKGGVNINGATASSLAINPVSAGDAGSYDCVLTNNCGSTTSNTATLTVNTPPSITGHPSAQNVPIGGSAAFSVTAAGSAPLAYQWRKGGVNLSNGGSISGATTPTLAINPVAAGDVGAYDVVVSNACGSLDSNDAALTFSSGCLPCDTSCDGTVNQFDIQPFLTALTGGARCSPCAADANSDGTVNQFDIQGFVNCLTP